MSHLYEGLPDKSRIHTSRRLERIEQTDTGVRVYLTDGSTEEGDMVIGADGVHSHVRNLMWEYADKFEPGGIPQTDKEVMSFGEYRGLFGVSTLPDNAQLGTSNTNMILGQDVTMLLFSQMGRAMWGITFKDEFQKAEQKGKATEAEIEAVAERFADLPMTKNITLGDVWKTNERHGLLYVEEGVLSKWHAGRIVLVGDSAHKVPVPDSSSAERTTNRRSDDSRPRHGRQHSRRVRRPPLQHPAPRIRLQPHSSHLHPRSRRLVRRIPSRSPRTSKRIRRDQRQAHAYEQLPVTL